MVSALQLIPDIVFAVLGEIHDQCSWESGVAADRRGLGAVPRDQQAAACADPGVVVGIGEKNLDICE